MQSEGKASGDCYVECVKEKTRETKVSSLFRRYIDMYRAFRKRARCHSSFHQAELDAPEDANGDVDDEMWNMVVA